MTAKMTAPASTRMITVTANIFTFFWTAMILYITRHRPCKVIQTLFGLQTDSGN
jgi:hypothetical protein